MVSSYRGPGINLSHAAAECWACWAGCEGSIVASAGVHAGLDWNSVAPARARRSDGPQKIVL